MQIVNLMDVPDHLPLIGSWIYEAFWQNSGQEVDFLLGLLREHIKDQSIPLTWVAMVDDHPAGTVSLIVSDFDERPTLSPWLAALYVQPDYRRQGIGAALVRQVVETATEFGIENVYLTADDKVHYYQSLGWQIVEESVGKDRLTVMMIVLP